MTIEKLFPSGDYEISIRVYGVLLHQRYNGYTRKEAIAEFREYVKEFKQSIIVNKDN